jgi:hypothetical protein
MWIRLTRRLAERIDDVDLSHNQVGDLIDLSPHDAEVLIAEGWAIRVLPGEPRRSLAEAADRPSRSTRKRRM